MYSGGIVHLRARGTRVPGLADRWRIRPLTAEDRRSSQAVMPPASSLTFVKPSRSKQAGGKSTSGTRPRRRPGAADRGGRPAHAMRSEFKGLCAVSSIHLSARSRGDRTSIASGGWVDASRCAATSGLRRSVETITASLRDTVRFRSTIRGMPQARPSRNLDYLVESDALRAHAPILVSAPGSAHDE
jgi:hypothetical protein